jgi:hypothetical protein
VIVGLLALVIVRAVEVNLEVSDRPLMWLRLSVGVGVEINNPTDTRSPVGHGRRRNLQQQRTDQQQGGSVERSMLQGRKLSSRLRPAVFSCEN